MTIKKLTPKQARWAEFLLKYNFIISYQSGKKNKKADALTRKPNKWLINEKDGKLKHYIQILLLLARFEHMANLQPIEIENKNSSNENITSAGDLTEFDENYPTLSKEVKSKN